MLCYLLFFFFNDTATTEIYTLSLHDALPIFPLEVRGVGAGLVRDDETAVATGEREGQRGEHAGDRKSTRLNSSHSQISYAVFCLKKKKKIHQLLALPRTQLPSSSTRNGSHPR